jgi:DNA-binding response OmpR family regulator
VVPEIVILDVSLPEMNVELALLLTALNAQCRLLLMSGRPETMEIVERAGKDAKFFEIVAKPVHRSYLLQWAARLDRTDGHHLTIERVEHY